MPHRFDLPRRLFLFSALCTCPTSSLSKTPVGPSIFIFLQSRASRGYLAHEHADGCRELEESPHRWPASTVAAPPPSVPPSSASPTALPPAPLAVALRRGRLPLRRCPRCRWRRWLFSGEAKSSEWNDGHAQACLEDHVQVPAPVASEPVSRRRSQPRRRRTDVPPLHPLRAAGGGSSAGRRSPRSGTTGTRRPV